VPSPTNTNDPHPETAELGYLSVGELTQRLSDDTVRSVDLVDALLNRISALDAPSSPTALRSVLAVAESARDDAARLDDERRRGLVRGPLHGVPVVIKDNVEVDGLPGTAGSTSLLGRPAHDAPLVTRLRAAGVIVLGSTNLSEWANIRSPRSTSGWSAVGGLVANPWALDRTAGGSSSGSGAAVAAGLSPLSVGTETDGSIICPASVNGVVGLKPTVGAVSTKGVVPICASQDSPGPLGRSVQDVATMFGVLAGQDRPIATDRAITVGFATTWLAGHPGTDERVGALVDALRDSGINVVDRSPASPEGPQYEDELTVMLAELHDDLGGYLAGREGPGVRSLADVIAYEDEHADVELAHFGHELFVQALATGGRRGERYGDARARNLEWSLSTCLAPAFEGVDVLMAAAFAPAWKSDLTVGGSSGCASCVTMPAAIAGWPIVSVPAGLVAGLPVGVALIGRPFDEWRLLEAAAQVELVVQKLWPPTRPAWRTPSRG
jgi:amidase